MTSKELHHALESGWKLRREGIRRRLNRLGTKEGIGTNHGASKRLDPVQKICREVKERILGEIEGSQLSELSNNEDEAIQQQVRRLLDDELKSRRLSRFRERDRRELEKILMNELTGAGLLQPLLDDPTLSDILVNGPDEIWIDRYGRLELTDIRFESTKHLMHILSRMVEKHGRHLEESTPYVDARLSDGSRLHAVISPISEAGPIISIRKARAVPLTLPEIISSGSVTESMAEFLGLAIERRLNILFCGGASTGKTSLLNIFSQFIPSGERVITIEETRELHLEHPHTVSLETRSANTEGVGEVDLPVLVRNALRMRADRIIVGEVRGREVFEMLQAMNVGHEGSLSTIHANSPKDAIRRLEGLAQLSGLDLPSRTVQEMIYSTIDLIVQVKRFPDGFRRVVNISEIGMTDNVGEINDIFSYSHQDGFQASGHIPGFGGRLDLSEETANRLFLNSNLQYHDHLA